MSFAVTAGAVQHQMNARNMVSRMIRFIANIDVEIEGGMNCVEFVISM